MQHILDNPIWYALNTGNKNLAMGNDCAKFFPKDIAPFVGLLENKREAFEMLYSLIPAEKANVFFTPEKMEIPKIFDVIGKVDILQMLHNSSVMPDVDSEKLIRLGADNVAEMLALTQATKPGPFEKRTIDFGHYYGIFNNNVLSAMAGQRMNPGKYMEISAVCTHPDYLGRGYAKRLLNHQVALIKKAASIPFLHVRTDNERAIQVYKSLGFETRREMHIYVLQKK